MSGRAVGQVVGPSLIAVLLWLGGAGVTAALSSDAERLADAEDERSLLLAELATTRAQSDDVPVMTALLTQSAGVVPAKIELADFVRTVDGAGDRAEVSIEQMAPLTVSSDTDEELLIPLPARTSAVSISIGASGSYEQIMSFADELLDLERLVVIDWFEVNTNEVDTSQLIADVELRIFTTEQLAAIDDDSDLFDERIDDEPIDEEPVDEAAVDATESGSR